MTTNKTSKRNSAARILEGLVGSLTLYGLLDAICEGEEWSKKKMAETLGVSASYYSDLVAGKKPVSAKKAAEWAKLLDELLIPVCSACSSRSALAKQLELSNCIAGWLTWEDCAGDLLHSMN